ncbi:hypothetical protein BH10ACI1_BH10ACI1_11490 [soil metagenome]
MFISLLLILLITFGGTALTYLYEKEDSLLVRLCAGNIIGSAVFSLVGFLLASFFGLSAVTVLISLGFTILPLALFKRRDIQRQLKGNFQKARGKLDGANFKKVLRFAYYVFFFLLFWFFFERAMIETSQGIFTGGSNNLGDLPFHLGAIFGFTDGNNFPPQNPSFAGAKFTYPFMADFLTASLIKLGAGVRDAMFLQNVFFAFSLLVILERFVFKITNNRLAGKIAPVLLFFSGGLGFLWFAKDFWQSGQSFFDFLGKLPYDYTIREDKFRWGNSLIVLFITQRSLLLGMPLTLIALQKLWNVFTTENLENSEKNKPQTINFGRGIEEKFSTFHFPLSTFLVGLLAGTLPLIHLHSLVVLFVVTAFLLILKPEKWREWIAFGVGVGVVAVTELICAMSGSATKTSEFIAFHFGWDAGETNIFWFWLKNTGFFIPTLLFGILLFFLPPRTQRKPDKNKKKSEDKLLITKDQLLFYLPFVFLFLVSNTMKLAPWEWDNIKVLIYWFVGSLPFAALALAWIYDQNNILKLVAVGAFAVLIAAGTVDVWRVVSNQINYEVFNADAVKVAELIKKRTAPNSLFLNAPTYNTAVVLTGRRSLMRYVGHLSSHGIDYAGREKDLQNIYEGRANADLLLKKYDIEYVIISPDEQAYLTQNNLTLDEEFFRKFPVAAESGAFRVYKVSGR